MDVGVAGHPPPVRGRSVIAIECGQLAIGDGPVSREQGLEARGLFLPDRPHKAKRLLPEGRREVVRPVGVVRRILLHMVDVVDVQPLREEQLHDLQRPRVRQHALRLGLEALRGGQGSLGRGLEQSLVGHGPPQEVGQPGGHLVVVERDDLSGVGRKDGLFDPVQEAWRLEHHLEHDAQRRPLAPLRRRDLEQLHEPLHRGRVIDRMTPGPLQEGGQPVVHTGREFPRGPHGDGFSSEAEGVHVEVPILPKLGQVAVVGEDDADGVGTCGELVLDAHPVPGRRGLPIGDGVVIHPQAPAGRLAIAVGPLGECLHAYSPSWLTVMVVST